MIAALPVLVERVGRPIIVSRKVGAESWRDRYFPEFRVPLKNVHRFLFYKGGVSDLGVSRVESGDVCASEAKQVRLDQRSDYRQIQRLSGSQDHGDGD